MPPSSHPSAGRTEPNGIKSVLLLGNYRPTLTVARTLAADGFNVVLGRDHDPEGSAHYSKAVHEIWRHPAIDAGGGRSFGSQLGAFLASRPDIGIVYPVAEKFVRWCAEHENVLSGRALVASPPSEIVLQCLDKRHMVEVAQALEVPSLPFDVAENLPELQIAAERLGYPVVVRPLSHLLRLGIKKAVIAADLSQLIAAFPAWPAGQDRLLIQKFARGARHDVYFAACRGEALRFLEVRITRTDSLDGTGLSVEGALIPLSPDLAEHTRRMLSRLDYTGIGCAQFLVDPASGSTCFLELNPRIAGSHRCTEWAGMDLTRLAISLAAGLPIQDRPFSYRPGAIYAWTYGDLGGLRRAVSGAEIGTGQALAWIARSTATWLRADFHLTFDIRDPLPTLMAFGNKLPVLNWPSRLGSKVRRSPPHLAEAARPVGHQARSEIADRVYSAASASGSTDT